MVKDDMEQMTGIGVDDVAFSEEENKEQIRMFEGDILKGLLAAADYQSEESKTIEVARNGIVYFSFRIRPLTEREYDRCKRKHTKYVRNKSLGIMMPESTDSVKYRSELIYQATAKEDRERTWDNRALWKALESKGKDVLTGTDVVDMVLMSGEKDAVVEQIDIISGYGNSNLEEVVKNS